MQFFQRLQTHNEAMTANFLLLMATILLEADTSKSNRYCILL